MRANTTQVRRLALLAGTLLAAMLLVTVLPATASPKPAAHQLAGALALPSPAPTQTPVIVPSALERSYNPFGDPWARKAAPNVSIPVALTPGCHRYEPKRSSGGPAQVELQFLSKSNSRLVFEECAELQDISDGIGAPLLRPFTVALRRLDPTVRFVGYFAGSVAPTGNLTDPSPVGDGEHLGLRYIDAHQESWFVHQDGMPHTRQFRVKHPSGDAARLLFGDLLDMTNADLRRFLARELVRSMDFHEIPGVMVDHCADLPQATPLVPNNVVPDAVLSGWADGCLAFLAAIKAEAGPSKLVFAVGYPTLGGANRPDQEAVDEAWFRRRLDVVDGILWEDPMGAVIHPPSEIQRNMDRLAARTEYARARGKYVGIFVNTNIAGQSKFSTTSAAQQRAFARFYLAAYLTIVDGPLAPLIPYTPVSTSDQFHSAAYFSEWDLDIGLPRGPRQLLAQAVWRRDFERARVFLNGGTSSLPVSLEDGSFTTVEGVAVRTASIPPKSGAIFLSAAPLPHLCEPRPPVQVVTRSLEDGAVQAELRAGYGEIRRLDLGHTPNTLVSVAGGPQGVSGGRSIDLPPGTVTVQLTLRRVSQTSGVFAQLAVTDGCGTWSTFVGRGTGQ